MAGESVDPVQHVTRLAPSPTGALHLGNARTFIVNWALARQRGWRIIMRIEDLDSPRVKPWAMQQAIDDLRWLGMDWDGEVVTQLADLTPYTEATALLKRKRLVYACVCTRKEIEQAQSAPHGDEHELRYPGTCRDKGLSGATTDTDFALRVRVPTEPVRFVDQVHGEQVVAVADQVGDFVIASKAGLPAYQLAVVVDDARQGVTDVVRGDDLLRSTGRQLLLYDMLDLGPPPTYWHLPLVLGPDGRRLAKRHGDTRIAYYREQGVSAERIIGLLAKWTGISDRNETMTIETFRERFSIERMTREAVTFSEADEAWLMHGSASTQK